MWLRNTFLLVLMVPLCGFAQSSFDITFDKAAERLIWIQTASDVFPESTATKSSETKVTLAQPTNPAGVVVYIAEPSNNALYSKPIGEVAKGWKLDPTKDKPKVYKVSFFVTHEGEAVSMGIVKAKVGEIERTALLAPANKGAISLYNLPLGPMVYSFESQNATGETIRTNEKSIALAIGAQSPDVAISVSEKVDTVSDKPESNEPAGAVNGAAPPVAPAPRGSSFFSNIIGILIGLGLVGGLAYGLWWFLKQKPAEAQAALQKLGITIPEDDNQTQQDAPLPPKASRDVERIVLDPGASTTPIATSAVVTTAPAQKRLVKQDGTAMTLSEGTLTFGREVGADVVLDGDSNVSRLHAALTMNQGIATISDSGSTNGTYVNGAKIGGPTVLRAGDVIMIGATTFRFEG